MRRLISTAILLPSLTWAIAAEPVQIVLDEVSLRGEGPDLTKPALLDPVKAMFEKAGLQVLGARAELPGDAVQLRFSIGVVREKSGSLAYQVSARSSRGRNAKERSNQAGQPPKFWVANLTAARSDTREGLEELQSSLASIAVLLYQAVPAEDLAGHTRAKLVFQLPAQPSILAQKDILLLDMSPPITSKSTTNSPQFVMSRSRAAKVSGDSVNVEIILGQDGKPIRACAKEGALRYHLRAVQLAMQNTFESVVIDGKPTKAKFIVEIELRGTFFSTEVFIPTPR